MGMDYYANKKPIKMSIFLNFDQQKFIILLMLAHFQDLRLSKLNEFQNAIEQKLRFEKGPKTGKLHIFSKKALKILRFDTLVGNQILITMIPFIFIKRVKIVVNKQKCVMLLLSSENRIYSLSRKCFTIFLKYKVVFTYSKNWT